MVALTRLNGSPLYINADLIKWAEATPDTTLTLLNGEKAVVRESCAEVVELVLTERLRLLERLVRMLPPAETLLRAPAILSASVPRPGTFTAETDFSTNDHETG